MSTNNNDSKTNLSDLRCKVADLNQLIPGLFSGASATGWMILNWSLITIIPGIALYLAKPFADDTPFAKRGFAYNLFTILAISLTTSGILYLLVSVWKIVNGGLIFRPKTPSQPGPFKVRVAEHVDVKRLAIIYNPHGGGQDCEKILQQKILPIWASARIDVKIVKTEYAGHAADYAKNVNLDDIDALCVFGGDGSFHEVVTGILQRKDGKKIPIGLLPGGTGNSLMHDLNCLDPAKAAKWVVNGDVHWMDANKVWLGEGKEFYSVNVVGWGIIGDVGGLAEAFRWLGNLRYHICGAWIVMKWINNYATITIDGVKYDGNFLACSINHSQHFGRAMRSCPTAQLDDGYLDCMFVKHAPRTTLLRILLQLEEGRHFAESVVLHKPAKQVSIKPARPACLNIDGDMYPCFNEVRVTCVPHAVQIFAPTDVFENTK